MTKPRRSRTSVAGGLGNSGNTLQLDVGGTVTADRILVASGSFVDGDLSIGAGDSIGGAGMIDGDLTLAAGGLYEFQLGSTLNVTGAVNLDSTFGVDDLLGVDSTLADGIYTLIDGTVSDFSLMGLENFGAGNAFDLGDGKSAYFSEGSLQITVIPEPGTLVMFALASLAFGFAPLYRRFRGRKGRR